MRLQNTRSRRLGLVLEVLEDRQLLAASLALPALMPIDSFSAAVLLKAPPVHPGTPPIVILHKVDDPATLWHIPRDGRLFLNDSPPRAVDDSVSTDGGTPLKIDVRANDSDPDGDSLYVLYSTKPMHGTLYRDSAHPNNFLYQADTGFVGTDSFTYSVYDRWGQSDEATVHILVRQGPEVATTNRPPVALADTATTHAGHPVSINVLANDSDPDGDKVKLDGIAHPANHGTVRVHNGRVVYTPAFGFVGNDSFAYRITDGHGHTALGQVTIHVTNKPVVAINDFATAHPHDPIRINALGNDHDGDGDPLHVVSFTQPAGGAVTQIGQHFVFLAKPGFYGPTSFTYLVGDGFGSQSMATVRVDVTNRPPIAHTDFALVHENKPITINVLGNDRDRDGDRLRLVSTAPTSKKGGTAVIDPANPMRIRYTPKAGFTGRDEFTYVIDDGHGGQAIGTVVVFVVGDDHSFGM